MLWDFLELKKIAIAHMGVSGIVVSIAAFQAVDPGSIPGWRSRKLFILFMWGILGEIVSRRWVKSLPSV